MLPCGKVPRAVVYSGVEGNNGILGNGPQLLRLRLQCGRFGLFAGTLSSLVVNIL